MIDIQKKLSALNGYEILILLLKTMGYKNREIAKELDTTEGYLRQITHRIKKKVRRIK